MSISNSPFIPGSHVAAYLRDSGGDEQDLSLDQQEKVLREWCQANRLALTTLYKDEITGKSTVGRENFLKLIHYFHSPNIKESGVILWKFSRFARNMDDAQFYKADLRRLGFIVHSLNDAIPDGLDGRFFESAIDWMNARYLDDLSTDVKRGVHHLLDQYGALGGTPPVGFRRESIDIGQRRDGSPHIVSRWVPDPEKWDLCKLAWEMRAAGATYPEIHAQTHLYRTNASYRDFFKNRLYLGDLVFGDTVIPDYAPALVTPETWEKVQEISNARSGRMISGRCAPNSSFRLSGLATCAECGSPLYGDVVTFHSRARDKGSFGYYRCTLANRTSGRECHARRIPKNDLEEAVFQKTFNYLRRDDVLPILQQDLEKAAVKNNDQISVLERIKSQKLASVSRRMGNIMNAIELRGMNDTLSARLDELEAEKTTIEAEYVPIVTPGKQYTLEDTRELINRMEKIVREANPENANQWFRFVLSEVRVERIGNKIFGRIEIDRIPTDLKEGSPDGSGSQGDTVMPGLGVPGLYLPIGITIVIDWPIGNRIPMEETPAATGVSSENACLTITQISPSNSPSSAPNCSFASKPFPSR